MNMFGEKLHERTKYKKLGWLHDSLKFIAIFVVLFVLFRFVIGFSVVSGKSMSPSYKDGEFVVYLRTVKNYKPGDVVCVWVPSGYYYIKRVEAVAGDSVEIKDDELYVNGIMEDDGYNHGATIEEEGAVVYPYVISDNSYFVMGDNREVSIDSRSFGEVSKLQVRGKIIFSFGNGEE